MWQWEVRGVAVREGGEIDIQLDKSTHNQWLAYLNGDSILCLTKSDFNSSYKAQLWQTGVYLYLHTKPLPLPSICSHHLLKW